MTSETAAFYETSYATAGLAAQRRYPNEELCRFIGTTFAGTPRAAREHIRVLEVGCGSGANLWMLAAEGFQTHGIELSPEGARLAGEMLASRGLGADIVAGDMRAMPYADAHFDVIVDVFSSYCLDEADFDRFLGEVRRLSKPGGRFFSYTPSKASHAFIDHAPARLLDASTLDGIRRQTSPYHGNLYPFRFASPEDVRQATQRAGLTLTSLERIGRTYRNGAEYFEYLSFVARGE